ncbi:hypothetical protein [Phascolarctobacterium succinatutens]|uniref:hypothetical protein n=1 Tax=Phascolarctobacterium succinatutens TaxID=626940 RepID=UPI0026ECB61C|nr:hypothetical protein [Phascolarctobacterium succinatutens]
MHFPEKRSFLRTVLFLFKVKLNTDEGYPKDNKANVRENWEIVDVGYGFSRRPIEEMQPDFNACYE